MSDGNESRTTLFDGTSRLAGEAAARSAGQRRQRILDWLAQRGPSTLFEIAAGLGYFDHQISGRFTELQREGLIVRTGERRTKPETGCEADVWRLASVADAPPGRPQDLGDRQGYPLTLNIPAEGRFTRAPMLARDDLPGIPYSIDNPSAGLRLSYRMEILECPGCGRPLKLIEERAAGGGGGGGGGKSFRCGVADCRARGGWALKLVQEPGRPEMPALVLMRV